MDESFRDGCFQLLSATHDLSLATAVMVCPHCNSNDVRKLSLIYASGTFETKGQMHGSSYGGRSGFYFGRFRRQTQSRLSAAASPPRKGRYTPLALLWLIGFFIVMAFAGRGRISTTMALFSVSYVLLLPGLVIGMFVYNLVVYPAKNRLWDAKFMCQRCGAVMQAKAIPKIGLYHDV